MSSQTSRLNRGRKPPISPDGRNTSSNPRYLGPYPVASPPERNPEPRSLNIPNNPDGRNTLSGPQYLGPYLVNKPREGNPQPVSPSVLSQKEHNTQAHPRNIASRPAANIEKGTFGKGRPQNDGTHPVASHLEATSPKPQFEFLKLLSPGGLQTSAYPKIFRTLNPSADAVRLAVYLLQRVYQERPILSRRYSTGELPARDKLANKFVMGIPKQRFGVDRRRDSTASAPPVMTAEYCSDPYRTAIREMLEAGEPRAPRDSEFAKGSKNYHAAGKVSKNMSQMHESEELDLMKQATSLIASKAYEKSFRLRSDMQVCWIGYDELLSFLGHRKAIKDTRRAAARFLRAALRTTGMRSTRREAPANRQKGQNRDRVIGPRAGKHRRKPKRNILRRNWKEWKLGI